MLDPPGTGRAPVAHAAPSFTCICVSSASGEAVGKRTSSLVVNPEVPTHSVPPSRASRAVLRPSRVSCVTSRRRALVPRFESPGRGRGSARRVRLCGSPGPGALAHSCRALRPQRSSRHCKKSERLLLTGALTRPRCGALFGLALYFLVSFVHSLTRCAAESGRAFLVEGNDTF